MKNAKPDLKLEEMPYSKRKLRKKQRRNRVKKKRKNLLKSII